MARRAMALPSLRGPKTRDFRNFRRILKSPPLPTTRLAPASQSRDDAQSQMFPFSPRRTSEASDSPSGMGRNKQSSERLSPVGCAYVRNFEASPKRSSQSSTYQTPRLRKKYSSVGRAWGHSSAAVRHLAMCECYQTALSRERPVDTLDVAPTVSRCPCQIGMRPFWRSRSWVCLGGA